MSVETLDPVTIVGCQLDIAWEDKPENFRRVRCLLNHGRLSAGSLVVLPEMFATGFSMDAAKIAEGPNGPTIRFMREMARQKGVYVLGGLARRRPAGRIFNEAVCVSPSGRCVAEYAKIHLFTPGGESEHFAAGVDLALFRWGKLNVAIHICYDLRFPELFRMAVSRGAEALVVIGNWPSARRSHWLTLLRARAIENQAYVIGVNRCGRDPKLRYAGRSVVISPRGETLVSAGSDETLISADVDRAGLLRWRRDFPALRDIRNGFRLKATRGRI
jgi:predicted amidohydrolase